MAPSLIKHSGAATESPQQLAEMEKKVLPMYPLGRLAEPEVRRDGWSFGGVACLAQCMVPEVLHALRAALSHFLVALKENTWGRMRFRQWHSCFLNRSKPTLLTR